MGENKTTIEISKSIRDRLRKLKDEKEVTYDVALNEMLTAFGYPKNAPTRETELKYTFPEYVFRTQVDTPHSNCVYTTPFDREDAVLYESESNKIQNIVGAFNSLMRYFGLYGRDRISAGSFTIHQDGYNWFGYGLDNFMEACTNQKERYEEIPNLDPHHHETAVYCYHGQDASILVYGQPYADPDYSHIKRANINILTEGICSKLDFISLLDSLPVEMKNGKTWNPVKLDWWNGRRGYGPDQVPESLKNIDLSQGRPINKVGSMGREPETTRDVIGYLFDNPYYHEPGTLAEELHDGNFQNDRIKEEIEDLVDDFTKVEKIIYRSGMEHAPTEDTTYTFERFRICELPSLGGIGGGSTVDISISPEGDYY